MLRLFLLLGFLSSGFFASAQCPGKDNRFSTITKISLLEPALGFTFLQPKGEATRSFGFLIQQEFRVFKHFSASVGYNYKVLDGYWRNIKSFDGGFYGLHNISREKAHGGILSLNFYVLQRKRALQGLYISAEGTWVFTTTTYGQGSHTVDTKSPGFIPGMKVGYQQSIKRFTLDLSLGSAFTAYVETIHSGVRASGVYGDLKLGYRIK